MTLRGRLVIALLAMLTVGLAVFGVSTYSWYARSQYQRLDDQVRASEPLVARQLVDATSGAVTSRVSTPHEPDGGPGNGHGSPDGGHVEPQVFVPPGTYAELRSATGAVLATIQLTYSGAKPKLPTVLPTLASPSASRILTVPSASGSGRYRTLLAGTNGADGSRETVVVALPMTEVTGALQRLVLTETVAALLLLLALSSGSWLILRRGLRPLEQMATTAGAISAGDLSRRVSPAGGPSEVGQLGLALNTMLHDIEVAFREREATERRLRQFLADASHELRTPLTSIQGFAELFRVSGDNVKVDLPTILRRIEQESTRMRGLVEDLLLLARLDETRPAERESVDLAVLAADACSDAVATAPERRVTLDAPEPVVIDGDQAHLRQAIANLVSNAVKHTPEGSPIEVSARCAGQTAVVSVRDHGDGLDEEAMAHVFDRFWQADPARAGTSAGLGLAIVSGIASEHGGTATVANAPDGGALFTLVIPANREA